MTDHVNGHGDVHTKFDAAEIAKFPEEYKEMNKSLSKRQIEILDGAELKSNEGMVFGGMYSDWKKRKGYA